MWEIFWNGGITNLLDVVEQMTYLMFIKDLDDTDNLHAKEAAMLGLHYFKVNTPLMRSKSVDAMDEIYSMMEDFHQTDIRGDVYEYILSKIAQSGINGQFRTPRHIIRMMVEMMDSKPTDFTCDPACGTSGFLVTSGDYLREKYKKEVLLDKQNRNRFMISTRIISVTAALMSSRKSEKSFVIS